MTVTTLDSERTRLIINKLLQADTGLRLNESCVKQARREGKMKDATMWHCDGMKTSLCLNITYPQQEHTLLRIMYYYFHVFCKV